MIVDRLAPFLGRWEGRGRAAYPTIEDVRYTEELRFRPARAHELVSYEQRTFLANGEASHWEVGFIEAALGAQVVVRNVQNNGRAERLEGWIVGGRTPGAVGLELESAAYAWDDLVVRARRTLRVEADRLTYRVHMATTTTGEPRMLLHLEGQLRRVGG